MGSGFLYVRKELCQDLVPVGLGFGEIAPREHEDISSGVGLNPAVLEGLSAALEMFLELGTEWIEARVIALSGQQEGLSGDLLKERSARGSCCRG